MLFILIFIFIFCTEHSPLKIMIKHIPYFTDENFAAELTD